jgi:hypothetical protein
MEVDVATVLQDYNIEMVEKYSSEAMWCSKTSNMMNQGKKTSV